MTPLGDRLEAQSGTVNLGRGLTIDAGALAGIVTRAGMLGSSDVATSEYLARIRERWGFPWDAVHALVLAAVDARMARGVTA